ncbi:MAG: amino acid ABC transporter permease [Actinomycetota bacterium]|nr:amino acid ABC transporter permease [Actinomycetota bacterium]
MTATTAPPTAAPPPAVIWAKRHLFRSPFDAALTVIFGTLALYVAFRLARFVLVTARWDIIATNLKLLMVGNWEAVHLPRIAISLSVLTTLGGLIAGLIHARQVRRGTAVGMKLSLRRIGDLTRRFGLLVATVLLLLALTSTAGPWLMVAGVVAGGILGRVAGGWLGQRRYRPSVAVAGVVAMALVPVALYRYLVDAVPLAEWEGFFFNISAAMAGIFLCFPLGVLLALGRRSKMPLLRTMATVYIEIVRGSPLFVLLLLANVSLEFFVPASIAPSKTVRAIVVFTIFTAAYLAEIVRGGLQSVPVGQEEAAKSLGLSPFTQMTRIVLPQALRNVIPAQIGQFISLFKDTTLAGLGLGILDMLTVSDAITQQPGFVGQRLIIETLTFTAFLFWVGSFTMSRESQRLERKLGVGTR